MYKIGKNLMSIGFRKLRIGMLKSLNGLDKGDQTEEQKWEDVKIDTRRLMPMSVKNAVRRKISILDVSKELSKGMPFQVPD